MSTGGNNTWRKVSVTPLKRKDAIFGLHIQYGYDCDPAKPFSSSQSESAIHVSGVVGLEVDWKPDPATNSIVSFQVHHYEFPNKEYRSGHKIDLSETVVRVAWLFAWN